MKRNQDKKPQVQANNPMHGVKLTEILDYVVAEHGWDELAERTRIRIFKNNPSQKSVLNFLRKTPWAREKIEKIYLESFKLR